MTLNGVRGVEEIYKQIKDRYGRKEALFGNNPLLFLNKLTSLKLYYDSCRSMEFKVSRKACPDDGVPFYKDDVRIKVDLHDGEKTNSTEEINCARYTYSVVYTKEACQSRYGEKTQLGSDGGKRMYLQAVLPYPEDVDKVGKGRLYSFLPTQLAFDVPIVCHAPFKLDASREFVDPQKKDYQYGNLWFRETVKYLKNLMKHVFCKWAIVVGEKIIDYLPCKNTSLIAKNNGKEKCLSDLPSFKGSHYLELPIFKTINNDYKSASEVFYFNPKEKVDEPINVAKWLGETKALFLAPKNILVGRFGITVQKDINKRLFACAMHNPQFTGDILQYLDDINYEDIDKIFPKDEELELSTEQIKCIMRYERFAKSFRRIACTFIGKKMRPKFSIKDEKAKDISEVLSYDFELSETPKAVEQYMKNCKKRCFCLDVKEDQFLPCYNGIVLSKNNPLGSFASFCDEIDKKNIFTIRIRLRKVSEQLDKRVEKDSGNPEDYIRELGELRKIIQELIGKNGYNKYIELINESGTNKERFIQELVQNADDCDFCEGQTPKFKLTKNDKTIITEYNETGFTRSNIRAITAIGESTKKRLMEGDSQYIGEKGVGFKSVFAVASEVKIFSGKFNFALTKKAPTIPKALPEVKDDIHGTKMEILLEDEISLPEEQKDILELCCCLRNLKEIDINGHKVKISDLDKKRVITIDEQQYVFDKYVHHFSVDRTALNERKNEMRVVNTNQQIVCYVQPKATSTNYPLYCGLPTKHRIQIPIVIDAPFRLTTSREEIVNSGAWNDNIRREMYNAIVKVINARKKIDRAYVMRFAKFRYRGNGTQRRYDNYLFDLPYLNQYDYMKMLRSEKILPTFDKQTFVSVAEKKHINFRRLPLS